jgi:uric acid-xanthine permease
VTIILCERFGSSILRS